MSIRFFHGTSTALLAHVEHDGGLDRPHLADRFELAQYYATVAAADDGSRPVVVEVTGVDRQLLRYDAAAMDEPVLADETVRDRVWDLAADLHPDWVTTAGYLLVPPQAWQVSWAAVGSAGYAGVGSVAGIVHG